MNGQGRTSIPAKLREELAAAGEDRLIITNLEECLVAYSPTSWKEEIERLEKLPRASTQYIEYVRFFVSGAQECPIDKQGRILIPPNLREHAGLKKDIVMVGAVKTIEIWSRERWEAEFAKSRDSFAANRQRLAEQGF